MARGLYYGPLAIGLATVTRLEGAIAGDSIVAVLRAIEIPLLKQPN
jgi:hypothetical protein